MMLTIKLLVGGQDVKGRGEAMMEYGGILSGERERGVQGAPGVLWHLREVVTGGVAAWVRLVALSGAWRWTR